MTNVPFRDIADFRDIDSLNHYRHAVAAGADPNDVLDALRHRSRDNARTPVQWNGGEQVGFTTGTPWLPANARGKSSSTTGFLLATSPSTRPQVACACTAARRSR
jgi:glycosidase